MSERHIVFGTVSDFLTGKTVADTHDERIRQRIARFLVEDKAYDRGEIDSRLTLPVNLAGDSGIVPVDFVIRPGGIPLLLVVYGRGSLVSRQRGTLAIARLMEPHIIPYAVVTNGEDALLMETKKGETIGEGLDAILSRHELIYKTAGFTPETLSDERREKESRILFAMDILTRRECES